MRVNAMPNRFARLVPFCAVLVLLAGLSASTGCQSTVPPLPQARRLQVANAATTSLTATMQTLTEARRAGRISDEKWTELRRAKDLTVAAVETLNAAAEADDANAFTKALAEFTTQLANLNSSISPATTNPS